MNKKHLATAIALTIPFITNTDTAQAQHMYKHDLGQVEVYGGIHWNPLTELELNLNPVSYGPVSMPASSNKFSNGETNQAYYGVKFGLGGKFSAEYRASKNVSERMVDITTLIPHVGMNADVDFYGRVTTQEYRLNYHPDYCWTFYVEDDHVEGYAKAYSPLLSHIPFVGQDNLILKSKSDRFMAGFTFGMPIGHGTAAWVGAGIGDGVKRLEAGVTYSINKHTSIDFSYQYNAVDNLVKSDALGIKSINVSNRGFYTGLSYWF